MQVIQNVFFPGMEEVGFLFFPEVRRQVKTDTEKVWKRQVMKEKENESDYCNNAFELTADEKKLELNQG